MFVGVRTPEGRRGRNLNQADKVASLQGGPAWYRYLSEHFSHGRTADWRGLSLHGGVISIDRFEDRLFFFVMLDYLVHQVAVMNAYGALCPDAENAKRPIEPVLAELRRVREAARAIQEAAPGRHDVRAG